MNAARATSLIHKKTTTSTTAAPTTASTSTTTADPDADANEDEEVEEVRNLIPLISYLYIQLIHLVCLDI